MAESRKSRKFSRYLSGAVTTPTTRKGKERKGKEIDALKTNR
jgi:hypothetical protein